MRSPQAQAALDRADMDRVERRRQCGGNDPGQVTPSFSCPPQAPLCHGAMEPWRPWGHWMEHWTVVAPKRTSAAARVSRVGGGHLPGTCSVDHVSG